MFPEVAKVADSYAEQVKVLLKNCISVLCVKGLTYECLNWQAANQVRHMKALDSIPFFFIPIKNSLPKKGFTVAMHCFTITTPTENSRKSLQVINAHMYQYCHCT